jgi:hypothetical protein
VSAPNSPPYHRINVEETMSDQVTAKRVLLDFFSHFETDDALCDNWAEVILADFKAARIAVVELPQSPSEYWGAAHQPQWNHYPFTRVDGDEIEIGARCEHVYRINMMEARVFAADVLAAADAAEADHG